MSLRSSHNMKVKLSSPLGGWSVRMLQLHNHSKDFEYILYRASTLNFME
jgi:hypothetical protein